MSRRTGFPSLLGRVDCASLAHRPIAHPVGEDHTGERQDGEDEQGEEEEPTRMPELVDTFISPGRAAYQSRMAKAITAFK
jgi:hypothetical protein